MNYKRELVKFKSMIMEEKNKGWERKCSEIDTYLGRTRSSEAWKFIRNLRNEDR